MRFKLESFDCEILRKEGVFFSKEAVKGKRIIERMNRSTVFEL